MIGHGVFNLPAALIAVAVTLLLIRGIKESASFNSIIVMVKVLVVVLFIVAGIGYVNTRQYRHRLHRRSSRLCGIHAVWL